MSLDRDQLGRAAGDFSAGDLDRDECDAFRRLLAEDPTLARECDFWRRVRGSLGPCERDPAAPGANFASAILSRAARERGADRGTVLRLPAWAMAGTAALAAALVVALLLRGGESPVARMYQEDGTAVVPQASVAWDDYMPLAMVSRVDPATAIVAHERQRPWLGMWTRPVTLVEDGTEHAAHLVLRVAGGSPAHAIGLHPGDVVCRLDGRRVTTERCIAGKIARSQPGDVMRVEWVRPGTGEHFIKELRAETAYE